MKKLIATALMAAAMHGGAAEANALPLSGIAAGATAPGVTLVSGGCGIYRHRNVYGFCVPNFYRGYSVYRGYGWRGGYGYGHGGYHGGYHRGGFHGGYHHGGFHGGGHHGGGHHGGGHHR